MLRVVHHQVNEDREQASEQRRPIPHLVAIDVAVPGRASMHELIAQDVKPIKEDRENPGGVMLAQGMIDRSPAPLKLLLPIRIARDTILVLPERVIDIAIVQKQSDFLAEPLPDGIVDAVMGVKLHQGREKRLKEAALALRRSAAGGCFDIAGIGRVEANPEKDEADIMVSILNFGSSKPR